MQDTKFQGIWIPEHILFCDKLSFQEKMLLPFIAFLDHEIHGCYASNTFFSEKLGISKSRCSEIISSLAKKGFVNIELEKKGKQITKRTVRLNFNFNDSSSGLFGKQNTPIRDTEGGYSKSRRGVFEIPKHNKRDIIKEEEYINKKKKENFENGILPNQQPIDFPKEEEKEKEKSSAKKEKEFNHLNPTIQIPFEVNLTDDELLERMNIINQEMQNSTTRINFFCRQTKTELHEVPELLNEFLEVCFNSEEIRQPLRGLWDYFKNWRNSNKSKTQVKEAKLKKIKPETITDEQRERNRIGRELVGI